MKVCGRGAGGGAVVCAGGGDEGDGAGDGQGGRVGEVSRTLQVRNTVVDELKQAIAQARQELEQDAQLSEQEKQAVDLLFLRGLEVYLNMRLPGGEEALNDWLHEVIAFLAAWNGVVGTLVFPDEVVQQMKEDLEEFRDFIRSQPPKPGDPRSYEVIAPVIGSLVAMGVAGFLAASWVFGFTVGLEAACATIAPNCEQNPWVRLRTCLLATVGAFGVVGAVSLPIVGPFLAPAVAAASGAIWSACVACWRPKVVCP